MEPNQEKVEEKMSKTLNTIMYRTETLSLSQLLIELVTFIIIPYRRKIKQS